MWGVFAFGFWLGVSSAAVVWLVVRETRPARPLLALPPATPRAIAKYRRGQLADIRTALARAGIKLREPPPPPRVARPEELVVVSADRRKWISPPMDDFDTDHEETRS